MARIVIHRAAHESGELATVPKDKLRAAFKRLEADPDCGKPLTRKLSGCYSVRVGGSENRLIYRKHPPDLVEVVAVGRRRGGEVHVVAEGRLA
jgi:mRNA-degrading endonuclease RelE of RelBE toxin-antitoxin system